MIAHNDKTMMFKDTSVASME